MQLKEAKVKIPRAIGIGLIIYFGLVVPGREVDNRAYPVSQDNAFVYDTPVPPVDSPEGTYAHN